MNTPSPIKVPELLRRHGLRPDKSLGQNFLIDESALQEIVGIADISRDDVILEIGAGLGSLTCYLAMQAREVVAVEMDERLLAPLEAVLAPYSNVNLIRGDILTLDPGQLVVQSQYLVVANIPYYITSNLFRHLLEAHVRPKRMVLTVQREVAERICAEPGKMSILALSIQVYGIPRLKARIPAGAFYPIPQVDSAVVRVDLHPSPVIPPPYLNLFFRLIKAGFSQKRKKLRNSLAGGMVWTKDASEGYLRTAGIDPRRRAETLSLDEWYSLSRCVDLESNPN